MKNPQSSLEQLQAESKARWRKILAAEAKAAKGVKPKSWTCEQCGTVLSNRIKKCPCAKTKKPKDWTCEQCGTVLSNRIKKCPCTIPKKPNNWTCQDCGRTLPKRIKKCPCQKVKKPEKKQLKKPQVNWEQLRAFLKRRY